jgi:hypothetical protein
LSFTLLVRSTSASSFPAESSPTDNASSTLTGPPKNVPLGYGHKHITSQISLALYLPTMAAAIPEKCKCKYPNVRQSRLEGCSSEKKNDPLPRRSCRGSRKLRVRASRRK